MATCERSNIPRTVFSRLPRRPFKLGKKHKRETEPAKEREGKSERQWTEKHRRRNREREREDKCHRVTRRATVDNEPRQFVLGALHESLHGTGGALSCKNYGPAAANKSLPTHPVSRVHYYSRQQLPNVLIKKGKNHLSKMLFLFSSKSP